MRSEVEQTLMKSIPPLAELYLGVALGQRTFAEGKSQEAAASKIWDTLTPLFRGMAEAQKIEAQNTSDVLKLIAQGKLSLAEAKELMTIMAGHLEATEIAELSASVAELKEASG